MYSMLSKRLSMIDEIEREVVLSVSLGRSN